MTRAERTHYDRLARLGCIVCRRNGVFGSPAEIHHIRVHTGAARKEDYTQAIPLCPPHHRQADGSARFQGELGYHCAPRTWEARYGTQRQLLECVNELLGVAA